MYAALAEKSYIHYITEFNFRRILFLSLDKIKFSITNYLCTQKFILIIVKILFC